jgi:hypothetical protein
VGLDCAAVNAQAYQTFRAALQPPPGDRLSFVVCDFSKGLPDWEAASFDLRCRKPG